MPPDVLDFRRREAEHFFRRIGITFAVYGDAEAQERLIPFDVIPRILAAQEWQILQRGLEQRVKASTPTSRTSITGAKFSRPKSYPKIGVPEPGVPPGNERSKGAARHLCACRRHRIVRVDPENFYVLEDNARTPSGVSYMLENREIMLRLFPELFSRYRVAPVENCPDELWRR